MDFLSFQNPEGHKIMEFSLNRLEGQARLIHDLPLVKGLPGVGKQEP
jgi:hypothetical protein